MRRPSVLVLVTAALALLGVATAVAAAIEGSVALVLTGVSFVFVAAVLYLADRRAQANRRSLERHVDRAFEVVGQSLRGEVASSQDLAQIAERLDRLDVRVDEAQRRLATSIDAARLEAAEQISSPGRA